MIDFIEQVNAALKKALPGLDTRVGWKERGRHTKPPSVVWTPDTGDYSDPIPPEGEERITASFAGRIVRFNVECWGGTLRNTNIIAKAVVRYCHRIGTAGSYTVEGEEWEGVEEGSGGAILGELCTLTIGVRDDVTDEDEATLDPPHTTSVSGGYT